MANPITVLMAEDDQQLAFLIKENLEEEGYTVISCEDGAIAWECFQKKQPDICLLDINMPSQDGLSLAKKIRLKTDIIPIIFLTAKSMTEDKIRGLESGADDYITKPFSMKELLLRMNVFIRRTKMLIPEAHQEIRIGKMIFYPDEMKLVQDNNSISLTQRESELLQFFCLHPNKALKREEILTHVWGKNDYFLGRSMDVFVTKLRKYLKTEPAVNIETVHNVGFRFNVG